MLNGATRAAASCQREVLRAVSRFPITDCRPSATTPPVPKWVKTVIAILLLPFCAGAISALVRTVRATGSADTFWVAFLGGAACWLVVFLLLPRPMLLYVFGHELTHALWTWIFGGRIIDPSL